MFRKISREIGKAFAEGFMSGMGNSVWRESWRQRNDSELELRRRYENPLFLERFGGKVYSQNDEDGIIEEIFRRIGETNRIFVEFGVQNGLESNCHWLLHKGWRGLWIEGDQKYYHELVSLFKVPIAKKRLTAINAFIDAENINALIGGQGDCNGDIDLLSVDVDGNDYWLWEAVKCVSPRVCVVEYNAKFPPPHHWVMKYDPKHVWRGDDNHGASLKAFEALGLKLGYQLVGSSITGCNAFFVKKELAADKFYLPATAENLYNPARNINYFSGKHAKNYIGD
jgi:hypothetical protein